MRLHLLQSVLLSFLSSAYELKVTSTYPDSHPNVKSLLTYLHLLHFCSRCFLGRPGRLTYDLFPGCFAGIGGGEQGSSLGKSSSSSLHFFESTVVVDGGAHVFPK